MVAFSCCLYDGGEAEKTEMDLIRETVWKQKFKRKDRVVSPGQNRVEGKCPLTPLEVLKYRSLLSHWNVKLMLGRLLIT